MPRKNSLFILVFVLLLGIQSKAQEYLIESKTVTIIYQEPGLSKDQIYTKALTWFSSQESTSVFTVETSFKEAGSIVVNEVNQVFYMNIGKLMYPSRSGMAELLSAEFEYRIEMTIEEESYLVVYTLTGMKKEMYGRDDLFLNCIDFEEIDETALEEYNKSMDKLLKMNAVFKKRRGIFLDNTKFQFEDVSQNILSGMTSNMSSLNSFVTSN